MRHLDRRGSSAARIHAAPYLNSPAGTPPRTGHQPGRPAGPRLEIPDELCSATVQKTRSHALVVAVDAVPGVHPSRTNSTHDPRMNGQKGPKPNAPRLVARMLVEALAALAQAGVGKRKAVRIVLDGEGAWGWRQGGRGVKSP